MTDAPAHAFRPTIFSRELRCRLGPDALEIDDGVATRAIPYGSVASLRIYRQPGGGYSPPIRRTILRTATGGTVVLQSTHYLAFARMEDRGATYRAFVEALVERIARANPAAHVTVGHSRLLWSIWVVLFAAVIGMFALALVIAWRGQFPLAALLYLGIVAAFVPVIWRIVRRSRPVAGDLRALPSEVLE